MPFSFFSDKNMLEKILRKNSFVLQMGCLSLLLHLQQLHNPPASSSSGYQGLSAHGYSAQSIPGHLNLNLILKLKMYGVSFISILPHMFITSCLLLWQENISYLCENPDTSKKSAFSILLVLLLSQSCDTEFSKPVLA